MTRERAPKSDGSLVDDQPDTLDLRLRTLADPLTNVPATCATVTNDRAEVTP